MSEKWNMFSRDLPPRGTEAHAYLCDKYGHFVVEEGMSHDEAKREAMSRLTLFAAYRSSGLIDDAGKYCPDGKGKTTWRTN